MKTTGPILLLFACVMGLQAQVSAADDTNPAVALPKRLNRVESTNSTSPGSNPAVVAAAEPAAQPAVTPAPPSPAPAATWSSRATTNLAARYTNVPPRVPPLSRTNIINRPRPGGAPPLSLPPPPAPGAAAAAPGGAEGEQPPVNLQLPAPATPLTAVQGNAPAEAEEKPIEPGVIKFQEASLDQVLEVYQELTGRTVMRATLPQAKITIRTQTALSRKEAIQALDTILSLNGIAMIPQGEKFVKAVPSAQVPTEAREFNELPHGALPNSGTPVSQIVRITNQMPREVAQALQPFAKLPNSILAIDTAGILILRDYAENVKRMMEVLQQIDVVPQQEFVDVVIPIKYALAGDIAQVLGSLTAGGGGGATTVGRQQTRTGLTSGGGGTGGLGQQGGMGMNQNYPGQQNYQQNAAGTTGFGGSAAGRSSFANRLQQIVNRAATSGGDIVILGTTKIIADERTNSLLIFASKQDLATISNIIAKLDVVLAQVLIEALIFEVSLNDSLNYGVSYLQKRDAQIGDTRGTGAIINNPPGFFNISNFRNVGTNAIPGGFSYAASIGKDLDVAATAIAGDSRFNVLSRPRIQTSHAVEANLFVGRTRPYPTGTSYGGVYGGYSSIQQLQIGITLSVLPLINPDGLVVMDIRQRTQSVGSDIFIENVGNVPETIDREANAKVAVRDGETVVLGGFISSEKRRSHSGVPILKDIPVLGALFRSNTKSSDRQELMVLIRPSVLPTPQDAALAVRNEKRAMPGVDTADREFQHDEAKIRGKADEAERKEQEKAAKKLRKREGLE